MTPNLRGPAKVHACDRCADTGTVTALLREAPENEYSFRCDLCFRAPDGLSWPLWEETRHATRYRRLTGAELAAGGVLDQLKRDLRQLLNADRRPRDRQPD